MHFRELKATWLPMLFSVACAIGVNYSAVLLLPLFFGMADVFSRSKDFYRLCDSVTAKDIRRMQYSRCQRNACIAASQHPTAVHDKYKCLGYRWYHLLPVGTFSIKQNPYLSLRFYKNLLSL